MNMNKNAYRHLICIILAAGQSKRMNQSKIILPWVQNTVIENIINAFFDAGVKQIIVVTGGYRELVEEEVSKFRVKTIFNPDYQNGEMNDSLKTGLKEVPPECEAIFVALGDQPEISVDDLQAMIEEHKRNPEKLIIPSYSMRRGHPWLVPSTYFTELRSLKAPETMRDFIQKHEKEIQYFVVKSPAILTDLDTPEDYERLKPKQEEK